MPVYPHLVVDARGLNIENLFKSDREYVKLFVNHLIRAVDMKRWGKIKTMYLTEPAALKGLSVCQFIHTSNLTLHIFENDDSLNLDLFSCKGFDPKVVIDVVRLYFNPTELTTQLINRGFSDFP